jgi:hypothetical protein
MANISIIEREYIERTLGMKGGYVLDFTNKTFQEFLFEVTGLDVYTKYEYESKAKLLIRAFKDLNDQYSGKLLMELLRYKKAHLLVKEEEKIDFNKSLEIAYRLLGKTPNIKINNPNKNTLTPNFDFNRAKTYFNDLLSIDNAQRRGFEFEKILYRYFEENKLKPRSSFRIIGEQIDGSFEFENEIYLLEAKWTYKVSTKADLVNFNEKVSSKSGFTRGLFISYSGFSEDAIQTFAHGRTVKITLLTVQELVIALEREILLENILKFKIRALAEEGNCFKNLMLY